MQVLRKSDVATLCLLGMVLGIPASSLAQSSYQPSLDSPTQQLGKSLGNLRPNSGGFQSLRSSHSDSVASVAPRSFGQTGRRASSYSAWDAPRRGTSSGGGIFSRNSSRGDS